MRSIVCPLATCHLLSIDKSVCRGQEEGCQRDHHHLDHPPRGPQCLRSTWRLVVAAGWCWLYLRWTLGSDFPVLVTDMFYVCAGHRFSAPSDPANMKAHWEPCNLVKIPSLTNACCICCNPRYTRCRKQNTSKNQEPMKRK